MIELQIMDVLKLVIAILKIYEYCTYHRPKNSINKKILYKTVFDKHEMKLKYYNQTNIYILTEYYNHNLNSYKNHKFGFPVFFCKTTVFTENFLYNIKEIDNDNEIDVSDITNYQKYFNINTVKVKDIYNLILKFKRYYSEKN